MQILYVEDDDGIAEMVKMGLEGVGYTVEIESEGKAGLARALEGGWGLIILDWMLPGLDGLEICRRLRARRDSTPILMLTARDTLPDEILGLDTGADDYLVKPFAVERLVARCRALMRREAVQRSRFVQLRDLEIDLVHRQVWRKGVEIALTPREWAVFEMLLRNEGRPVSKEQLYQRIWHDDASVGSNVLEVYIRMLRAKLDDNTEVKLIKTLYGIGYLIERSGESE